MSVRCTQGRQANVVVASAGSFRWEEELGRRNFFDKA